MKVSLSQFGHTLSRLLGALIKPCVWTLAALCWGLFLLGCAPKVASENNQNALALGAAATDILTSRTYQSVTFEVMGPEGHELSPVAIQKLRDFISTYAQKPAGVRFVRSTVIPTNQLAASYTLDDLIRIESQSRRMSSGSGNLVISLLVLSGASADDRDGRRLLGTTYSATSIALFKDSIRADAQGQDSDLLEAYVATHELGHIMGLRELDNHSHNAGAQDSDPSSDSKHCDNSRCLMHRIVSYDKLTNIFQNTLPDIDERCKNELRQKMR